MDREEALKKVRQMSLPKETMEILEALAPELKGSEDERIRKELINQIEKSRHHPADKARWIAYLEKQKEQKPAEVDESTKRLNDNWMKQHFDDYKERNPAEWSDTKELVFQDICNHLQEEGYSGWVLLLNALHNGEFQPKPEWSEEDKKIIDTIVYVLGQYIDYKAVSGTGSGYATPRYSKEIAWLKSLRPQPHKEVYQAAKHDLAIKFMNYLDENRPEGKMSLSNGECEDIDKAFKENDWAKIMRYVEKYRPSWKPSEEQMKAVKHAYNSFPNDCPTKSNLRLLYYDLEKLIKI